MMKYIVGLMACVFIGCAQPTTAPAPYSPEGEYYVAPGTFKGTWTDYDMKPDGTWLIEDTDLCTAVVKEADSILIMSVTNNTTAEVRTLQGVHFIPIVGCFPCGQTKHAYHVMDSSSSGDRLDSVDFYLAADGNGFNYGTRRLTPSPGFLLSDFNVSCSRISK